MNIYLYNKHIIRRFWLARKIKKIMHRLSGETKFSLIFPEELGSVNQNVVAPSPKNIYFLQIDLNNNHEIHQLKTIRKNDPFSIIVIFINQIDQLNKLFDFHISAYDFIESSSSLIDINNKIQSACEHSLSS